MKRSFEDELISGMQDQLRKYAEAETPKLSRAAECLHSALELLEQQGLYARADEVLQLLQKLAKGTKVVKTAKIESLQQIMDAGVSQRDLMGFARGEPRAIAKLNLVLRRLGMAEHEIAKFLGHDKVMSEEKAHKVLNPNEAGSMLEFESLRPPPPAAKEEGPGFLEFKSMAQKKNNDPVTKGWTPEKGVKNLKEYGMPMKPMSADDNCAVDVSMPLEADVLGASDMDIAALIQDANFDDDLLNADVTDSLEVSEADAIEDFEGERD